MSEEIVQAAAYSYENQKGQRVLWTQLLTCNKAVIHGTASVSLDPSLKELEKSAEDSAILMLFQESIQRIQRKYHSVTQSCRMVRRDRGWLTAC